MEDLILSLMNWTHNLLAVFAISFLITDSKISYLTLHRIINKTGIDVLKNFVTCIHCVSFWVSLIFLYFNYNEIMVVNSLILSVVCLAVKELIFGE